MPSFSKLDSVYLCILAIFEKYNSHVVVTKTIYFVRYCNKRSSTENWLEAKVNVVQIQKNDIVVLSSLRSISTGLCLKNFEKSAHPMVRVNVGVWVWVWVWVWLGLGIVKVVRVRVS